MHGSIWWPCLIVLNFGFWEWVLLLCTTDSPISVSVCPNNGMAVSAWNFYFNMHTDGNACDSQSQSGGACLIHRFWNSVQILLPSNNYLYGLACKANQQWTHISLCYLCGPTPPAVRSFLTTERWAWEFYTVQPSLRMPCTGRWDRHWWVCASVSDD